MQVYVYKKAAKIFEEQKGDDITQMALLICYVFKLSYEQVNNMHPKQFTKYINSLSKKFTSCSKKPFYRKSIILTNAKDITFGQFVDLMHFYPQGEIDAMHFIAATILKKRTDVLKDAEKMDQLNVNRILQDYNTFNTSFKELIDSYAGLFEIDLEAEEQEEKRSVTNNFMQKYGWIYSATELMKLTGDKLEDTFKMPIVEALNYLSYLKAYGNYMKEVNK